MVQRRRTKTRWVHSGWLQSDGGRGKDETPQSKKRFVCLFVYLSVLYVGNFSFTKAHPAFLLQGSSAGITAAAGCMSGLQAFRQLSVAFRLYLLSLLERERHCGGTLSWPMTYYHNLASVGAQTSGSGIQRGYQRFNC